MNTTPTPAAGATNAPSPAATRPQSRNPGPGQGPTAQAGTDFAALLAISIDTGVASGSPEVSGSITGDSAGSASRDTQARSIGDAAMPEAEGDAAGEDDPLLAMLGLAAQASGTPATPDQTDAANSATLGLHRAESDTGSGTPSASAAQMLVNGLAAIASGSAPPGDAAAGTNRTARPAHAGIIRAQGLSPSTAGDAGATRGETGRTGFAPVPDAAPGRDELGGDAAGNLAGSAPESASRSRPEATMLRTTGEPSVLSRGTTEATTALPSIQATSQSTPAGMPQGVNVSAPVGASGWGQEFAHGVSLIARAGDAVGNVRSAEIRVTPDTLGPVQVRITIRDGEANLDFVAAQAETRQAIESALPQLREMLESGGLSLGEANVRGESRDSRGAAHESRRDSGNPGEARGTRDGDSASASEMTARGAARTRIHGLVDLFA